MSMFAPAVDLTVAIVTCRRAFTTEEESDGVSGEQLAVEIEVVLLVWKSTRAFRRGKREWLAIGWKGLSAAKDSCPAPRFGLTHYYLRFGREHQL